MVTLPSRRPLPRLVSVKDYATEAGVPPRVVYDWVAAGVLPVRRVGRVIRIVAEADQADEPPTRSTR